MKQDYIGMFVVVFLLLFGILTYWGVYRLSCKYEFIAYIIDSRCYNYKVIKEKK